MRHSAAAGDDDGRRHAPADGPSPEAQRHPDRARAAGWTSAIAALPEEFREVLILREMEDMSYREIAAVTGAPIGTVMSRLARGARVAAGKMDARRPA